MGRRGIFHRRISLTAPVFVVLTTVATMAEPGWATANTQAPEDIPQTVDSKCAGIPDRAQLTSLDDRISLRIASAQERSVRLDHDGSGEVIKFALFTSEAGDLPEDSEVPLTVINGDGLEDRTNLEEFVRALGVVQSPTTLLLTICAKEGLISSGSAQVWLDSKARGLSWEPYLVEIRFRDDRLWPKLMSVGLGLVFALAAVAALWFAQARLAPAFGAHSEAGPIDRLELPDGRTHAPPKPGLSAWVRAFLVFALLLGAIGVGVWQWQTIDSDPIWGGTWSEVFSAGAGIFFPLWSLAQAATVLGKGQLPDLAKVRAVFSSKA